MRGQENRLGALLVSDSIVTRTQLNHALQVQKEQEKRQRLGAILVELGYVTRRKLRSVIRRYGKRTLFGELLVEEGTITREQLEQALDEHKISGDALGTVMVRMGLIGVQPCDSPATTGNSGLNSTPVRPPLVTRPATCGNVPCAAVSPPTR